MVGICLRYSFLLTSAQFSSLLYSAFSYSTKINDA
jgi:hypothetical protein